MEFSPAVLVVFDQQDRLADNCHDCVSLGTRMLAYEDSMPRPSSGLRASWRVIAIDPEPDNADERSSVSSAR